MSKINKRKTWKKKHTQDSVRFINISFALQASKVGVVSFFFKYFHVHWGTLFVIPKPSYYAILHIIYHKMLSYVINIKNSYKVHLIHGENCLKMTALNYFFIKNKSS